MSKLVLPTGVNPVLVEFMETLGLKVGNNVTLDGLNKILQDNWFAKDAAFRYKITGDPPTDKQVDYLRALGHVDAVHTPDIKNTVWTEVLFCGAMLKRVRDRLTFLHDEDMEGLDVRGDVYMLGSERKLDPVKESKEALQAPWPTMRRVGWQPPFEMKATEIEMMKYVVNESVVAERWPYVYVQTPDVPVKDAPGKTRPANTYDTVVEYYKRYGPGGRTLVVSNQPFVSYQETIVRRILPRDDTVVCIGPAADVTIPLKTFLDNIAKEIYERNLLSESVEA